jgi:GT2 family glycosyltransferase
VKGSVSVVLPSLEGLDLLEQNLPPLLLELERRGAGDEAIVVDDTGRGVLAEPLARRFPAVRVVTREENGGFARALASGVEAARHPLVFSMNTDVRVRPGFLAPLVAALEPKDVAAVAPLVLLGGDPRRVESVVELAFEAGRPAVLQPLLGRESTLPSGPTPIAFAVGGTCLFEKRSFLERGGFDPLYEPFYWEDVDLCFELWSRGRRVLLEPASVVEHHHRGTIGKLVSEPIFRAAIERNRLLFAWKFLDDPALLAEHVEGLLRSILDAWIRDERAELLWLVLALERLDRALEARTRRPAGALSFREILERSRPRLEGPG